MLTNKISKQVQPVLDQTQFTAAIGARAHFLVQMEGYTYGKDQAYPTIMLLWKLPNIDKNRASLLALVAQVDCMRVIVNKLDRDMRLSELQASNMIQEALSQMALVCGYQNKYKDVLMLGRIAHHEQG